MKTYISLFLLMVATLAGAQVTTFPSNIVAISKASIGTTTATAELTVSNKAGATPAFQVFGSNNPVAVVTVEYVDASTPFYQLSVPSGAVSANELLANTASFLNLNVQFAPIFADGAGVAGHVLTSIDGIGTATWAAPGAGTVAAPVSSVQFNSNGFLRGSALMTFTNGLLTVANTTKSSNVWDINNVKYWGATGNGVTDDSAALFNCNAFVTTNGGSIYIPSGTFSFTNLLLTAPLHGDGLTSVLKQTGNGVGLQLDTALALAAFRDFRLICTNVLSTVGIRIVNSYDLLFDSVFIDSMSFSYPTSSMEIVSSGVNNSALITLLNCDFKNGMGDALRVTGGGAAISLVGTHLHACLGYGFNAPTNGLELFASGNSFEGNAAGQFNADYLVASSIQGCHFENSVGATNALMVLGRYAACSVVNISGNSFGGTSADYGIDFPGVGGNKGITIQNNKFSQCAIAGVHVKCSFRLNITQNELGAGCPAVAALDNYQNEEMWLQETNSLLYTKIGINQNFQRFGTTGEGSVLLTGSGATTNRPNAASAGRGALWYDTTIKSVLSSDGTNWLAGSSLAQPISSVQFNSNGMQQGSAGFVFTNGLVGIGTAPPTGPLTIKSLIGGASLDIVGRSSGADEGYIQFFNRNGTTLQGSIYGATNRLVFTGPSGAEVLTISNNSIGIGTLLPSSKLDVPGEGRFGTLIATNATIPTLNTTTLNANTLNLTNALGSNQVRLAITNLTDVSVPGRSAGDSLFWNPTMLKWTNGQPAGGGSVSGNSNQIPYLNVAGTGFLFNSHDKSAPGFGFQRSANGNIGAMLIHVDKDEDIGLVQIGPPNPAANISTFVPSLSISNRYAGDGQTTQDMVRVNFVDIDGGSSTESFIQTWRSWVSGTPPASTLVSYAAALRKDGQLMVAHGVYYPSNSLSSTMPTAAQLGPGGIWVGNSNASYVAVRSLNGTTTTMTVLVP